MRNINSDAGFLLVILVICGILIATNPTKSDFMEFVDNQLVKMQSNTSSTNDGNVFLSSLSKKITYEKINTNSYRDNYFLFSVFTVKNKGRDYKFIGVSKIIYPKLDTINVKNYTN